MSQIVSVIGLGKAGLPLSAVIANQGYQVIGVDISESRCQLINRGQNPLPEEPGLSELLSKYGGKTLIATTKADEAAEDAQVHIVIVPIFINNNKEADYKYADQAFLGISKGLKKGDLVVMETTVPPGTTEGRIRDILEKNSGLIAGEDFSLAYSPERIMTGYSISRFQEYPKVVSGYTDKCRQRVLEFYRTFSKTVNLVSSLKTAELIKVAEGIFRDVNIGLANELKMVSDELGVDFLEMREYANHNFCNIHQAGIGVGGHCIPVYPWFLLKSVLGETLGLPLINQARETNDKMIYYWRDKLLKYITCKSKIGILGINYRAGVKELAYSRALPFIKLLEESNLEVLVQDPFWTTAELAELGLKSFSNYDEVDVMVAINPSDFTGLEAHKVFYIN